MPTPPRGSRGAELASRSFEPEALTTARQLRGLRKNELARKVDLTPAAVSQYELGQSRPSATVVAQLAMALGCPPRSSPRGTRTQRCPARPTSEVSGRRRSCSGIRQLRSARSSGGWLRPPPAPPPTASTKRPRFP
ncbi:helix-turn-helix domain-containing protein [Streptomyces caniscabiei]|uniref:helix-turn-helix domain-containing protein n=1 Tax=Streptomyces caniscabiei TaxID=2746961 RepID=UPI0038D50B78